MPVVDIMNLKPSDLARAALQAYVDKDRDSIEALLGKDYHFTSPLDNRLDRATYFRRCWPNSASMAGFECIHSVDSGGRVFVVYEATTEAGKRFRNTEMHVVRDGRIIATEVYFGWDVPHKARPGGYIEDHD